MKETLKDFLEIGPAAPVPVHDEEFDAEGGLRQMCCCESCCVTCDASAG